MPTDLSQHIEFYRLRASQTITKSNNSQLTKSPNLERVRMALFNIDSNKTPGSYRCGAGLFKNYLHIIKRIFLITSYNFSRTASSLKN